jgi:hypothetical protein
MRTLSISIFLVLPFFIQAQPVMTVQAGAHITTTGKAFITLTDISLDLDGVIQQGPGDGRFVFNGPLNAVITGTASPAFDELEIAKTAKAQLALKQSIIIGSGIIFTDGTIDLNSHNILLEPNALLMGESATSRITGEKGGYVQIKTSLNAPAGVNPGNLGLVISSRQDLGPIQIRRGHQSQTNGSNTGASILRYYDLVPANNVGLEATLRVHYFDEELNGLDEGMLTLFSSTDLLSWTNRGFSARSAGQNYVEQTGINSFSRFTLSEINNPLPLVWSSFNTRCDNGHTTISWKTLQEQNTARFIIRRSTDGIHYTSVDSLPAAGNSQSELSYSYTDQEAMYGNTYYQILQEDIDGRQTYSPVLWSRCELQGSLSVYPNPVQGDCVVRIESPDAARVTLRVYNILGMLLQQHTHAVQPGANQLLLSLHNRPAGTYLLTVSWRNTIKTIKLVKY